MPAPSATERPKAESPTSLGGLRPFMRPYRTQIGLAMLFLVLAAVATLLFPVALRGLIDGGLVAGDRSAQAMGMVLAVVDDVFAHCTNLAQEIADNAPLTIQAAKKTLVALAEDEKDMTSVKTAIDACFKSHDYAEGRLAFAQKRSPQFTGQ